MGKPVNGVATQSCIYMSVCDEQRYNRLQHPNERSKHAVANDGQNTAMRLG